MRTTSADIYGIPEVMQTMLFEYEHIVLPDYIEVKYVQMKLGLEIEPHFLKEDLELGIAEDLGVCPTQVRIKCEIQEVQISEEVSQEMKKRVA